MSPDTINHWLGGFALDAFVHEHVAAVMIRLPEEVRADLMNDPQFAVCDFEPGPSRVFHVPMRFSSNGKAGRSIVLKRTIKRRPVSFARWVIAHELAHAYLRHGGRWPEEDPEQAADALAAAWGFPRPQLS
jgi:hypothetical protein